MDVIRYFSCKFGKSLTGNNCTRPSFKQTKMTLAEFCVPFDIITELFVQVVHTYM